MMQQQSSSAEMRAHTAKEFYEKADWKNGQSKAQLAIGYIEFNQQPRIESSGHAIWTETMLPEPFAFACVSDINVVGSEKEAQNVWSMGIKYDMKKSKHINWDWPVCYNFEKKILSVEGDTFECCISKLLVVTTALCFELDKNAKSVPELIEEGKTVLSKNANMTDDWLKAIKMNTQGTECYVIQDPIFKKKKPTDIPVQQQKSSNPTRPPMKK
jgi:hypothetical protein